MGGKSFRYGPVLYYSRHIQYPSPALTKIFTSYILCRLAQYTRNVKCMFCIFNCVFVCVLRISVWLRVSAFCPNKGENRTQWEGQRFGESQRSMNMQVRVSGNGDVKRPDSWHYKEDSIFAYAKFRLLCTGINKHGAANIRSLFAYRTFISHVYVAVERV